MRLACGMFKMASTSETGLQLFARLIPRPSLVGIDEVLFPDGPNPKDVIEVSGEHSCGKTLLFTQFIMKCILPKEFKTTLIGGLKAGVVLLNTDHHFQMYKLISVMENYLKRVGTFSVSDVEDIVKSSLGRLIMYDIVDSAQLQVTFHAMQTLVSNQPEIGLILLDSVCAFYWQDAMTTGMRKMDLYIKNTIKTMQRSLGDFKGVIMYTRPSYFQSKSSKSDATSSIPATGLSFVNQKIVLRQVFQENMFCADIESTTGRFTKMYTINSSGVQWVDPKLKN